MTLRSRRAEHGGIDLSRVIAVQHEQVDQAEKLDPEESAIRIPVAKFPALAEALSSARGLSCTSRPENNDPLFAEGPA